MNLNRCTVSLLLVITFSLSNVFADEQRDSLIGDLETRTKRLAEAMAALTAAQKALEGVPDSVAKAKIEAGISAGLDLAQFVSMVNVADGVSAVRSNVEKMKSSAKDSRQATGLPPRASSVAPAAPAPVAPPVYVLSLADVEVVAKNNAVRDYPGNLSVQQSVVSAEIKAYKDIQSLRANGTTGVPKEILDDIINSAMRTCYWKYCAAVSVIQAEIATYRKLHP